MKFNTLVKTGTIFLAAFLSANGFSAPEKDYDDLARLIKSQAEIESLNNVTDPGRRQMLEEMKENPQQLSKDIVRFGTINLTAKADRPADLLKFSKTKKILAADLSKDSTLEIYQALKNDLVEAVKAFPLAKDQPLFDNERNPQRIGSFLISEILYPLAQTFSNHAYLVKYTQDNMDLISWQSDSSQTKKWTDIIYSPNKKTITVTTTVDRSLQDLMNDGSAIRKPLTVINSTIFNLANGSITYSYSYSIDKKKKEFGPFPTLDLPK